MRERTRHAQDRMVRALARLSLVAVLAVMGALFIGSAAAVGTPTTHASSAATQQQAESEQGSVLSRANPIGLLIGVAVIGGGLTVLMIGAFKPQRRDRRDMAELLSR